jgi:hypothetical protein
MGHSDVVLGMEALRNTSILVSFAQIVSFVRFIPFHDISQAVSP